MEKKTETTIQRLGFGVFGFRRNGRESGKYYNGFLRTS